MPGPGFHVVLLPEPVVVVGVPVVEVPVEVLAAVDPPLIVDVAPPPQPPTELLAPPTLALLVPVELLTLVLVLPVLPALAPSTLVSALKLPLLESSIDASCKPSASSLFHRQGLEVVPPPSLEVVPPAPVVDVELSVFFEPALPAASSAFLPHAANIPVKARAVVA